MTEGVLRGRFTTPNEEPVVLFTFGIRVNRLRDVRTWWPVLRTVRPMFGALAPEAGVPGYLGGRVQLRGIREISVVQYWRSVDELLAFAELPVHKKGFKAFHRAAAGGGSTVGLWHELFAVPAGHHESIYGNVPRGGLAGFLPLTPVRRRRDSALQRLDLGVLAGRSRSEGV
jgi:fumigallin biosynthesis monooxygenase-like protein